MKGRRPPEADQRRPRMRQRQLAECFVQANTHRGTATIKERNLAGRRWLWADEFGEEPYRDGQSLTNKTAIASSA
ncbi:hypothetical protein T4D_14717 [Trichinella pseudospiralis]|uniref:Uncharacterized protein n=1 Tax=Trichinella pseudospiralis TaxID=6337 RepID=A0A0V1FVC4_TRIPS|nr:hypothetical protein T4D_14717 [Trichinella pseudospiralis]